MPECVKCYDDYSLGDERDEATHKMCWACASSELEEIIPKRDQLVTDFHNLRAEVEELKVRLEKEKEQYDDLEKIEHERCKGLDLQVGALQKVAKGLLPLNGRGGCHMCFDKEPPKDFIHFDSDNIWGGDRECLWGSTYEDARKILGIQNTNAQCTCPETKLRGGEKVRCPWCVSQRNA